MGEGRRLTSELVEALEAPTERRFQITWDLVVPGFGVCVMKSGVRSYVLNYRTTEGRQRRKTIGRHPAITASSARKIAREMLVDILRGADPIRERREAHAAAERNVESLGAAYLEHLRGRTRPPTQRTFDVYRRFLDRWFVPTFRGRPVAEITRDEVRALHRRIGTESGPYMANRVLQFCVSLARYGDTLGWWPGGGAIGQGIDRYPEMARNREREVMLTDDQFKRLLEALDATEKQPMVNLYSLACVRFLMWSGWRPEEAFQLQWSDIDFEGRRVRLTRTKTSEDGEQRVLLDEALSVLRGVQRVVGHPYVFPGNKPRRPLTHVKKTWQRLRAAAGLEDLGGNLGPMRLRDLRHNFVAQLMSQGFQPGMVGKLVGHKSIQTTLRYGGFAPDSLREMGNEGFATLRRRLDVS